MNEPIIEQQSGRILVVDDTTANLKLLTDLLTGEGYITYPASDGEIALEFIRTTLPDLILLDIGMPGMNGYEVCRRLKADERSRVIPVIFISGLENERDKLRSLQRLNRELRAVSDCNKVVVRSDSEHSLLNNICKTSFRTH